MQLAVYSKTMKSSIDNRSFRIYLSRLQRKPTEECPEGEEVPVRVQFREGTPLPTLFPCNIVVDKANANLSKRKYTDKDGKECITYTLWVNEYKPGEPFEDHSLDDFVD